MASGDFWQLIDKQTLAGQEVLNVYFFYQQALGGAAVAADLIDSFEGQLLPDICAVQSGNVLHTELSATNLFDVSDRAVLAISEPGTAPNAEYHSNFDAVGVSLIQDNGIIKNGSKRYAGLPESYSADGVITSATYIALLDTLMAALTGTLDWGIIATWLPIIVQRIQVSPGVYRLPETSGEGVYGAITDAVWNPQVTSQVSRKIGVGV